MDVSNDNSYLISARLENDDLILRFDQAGGFEIERMEDCITEVTLRNPSDSGAALKSLDLNIDDFIWGYEFSNETGIFSVSFDSGDVCDIRCSAVEERTCDMSLDELFHKYQILSEEYARTLEENWKGRRNYAHLRHSLVSELAQELGNLEERLDFYRKHHSEKVDRAEAGIRLCKKYLNTIDQIHRHLNA